MDSREQTVVLFNAKVTALLKIVQSLHPNDMDLERLRNKLRIAKAADEEFLIRELGPYLYKYQTPIIQGRDVFFVDTDGLDIATLSPDDQRTVIGLRRDLAGIKGNDSVLLDRLRKSYRALDTAERENIKATVLTLLECYLLYLLQCKDHQSTSRSTN